MADFSFRVPDPGLQARLERAVDPDARIPRALEALGPISGRRVILLDADRGLRARQLEELGGRVTSVPDVSAARLPKGIADLMVACWSAFRGGDRRTEAQIAEAELALRPGGRLLVLHDYGRDDVSRLFGDPAREREQLEWSRRSGWFLVHDFKIRVIHTWWAFESLEEARAVLPAAFGEAGSAVADGLTRPRLEYKLALYHRSFGISADAS